MRDPWMKFYPQDWRADEKLRMCSLAARGLWIEMLAIMHRSERYGQLLINGRVPTDAQLAMQVGALPDLVTTLVVELEEAGVFSRAASGAIYSRRMTRDGKKAEIARRNGKNGGNPSLSNKKGNSASVKGEVKPPDKPEVKPTRAHKPDARGQSSDTNVSADGVLDFGEETAPQPPPVDPVKLLFDTGIALLAADGDNPSAARSLIGKWRRDYGDGEVMAAIGAAQSQAVSEPRAWITQRLAGRTKPNGRGASQDDSLQALIRLGLSYGAKQ